MKAKLMTLRKWVFGILIVGCSVFICREMFFTYFARVYRRAWLEAVNIPRGNVELVQEIINGERLKKCPYCGGAITFFSVAPSGQVVMFLGTEIDQRKYTADDPRKYTADKCFDAYCATPDIKGRMPFQFGPFTGPVMLPDEMVSWYFAKRLEDLTDDEIKEENTYRARIGKKHVSRPLPKGFLKRNFGNPRDRRRKTGPNDSD